MFRRILALGLLAFALAGCARAQLVWMTDLAEAQREAGPKQKGILVFFDDPDSPLASHYIRLFIQPPVQTAISSQYLAVRFLFRDHMPLAYSLNAFKAGIINIYASDGRALGQIDQPLSSAEFRDKLRHYAYAGLGSDQAALAERSTTVTHSVAVKRGEKIKGPMEASLRNSAAISMGVLEKGKPYVLVLEGIGSVWGRQQDGVDPLYIYRRPSNPEEKRASRLLRIGYPGARLEKWLPQATGSYPPYNPSHQYELYLLGEGETLYLSLQDLTPNDHKDNSGSFQFTLYEAERWPGTAAK